MNCTLTPDQQKSLFKKVYVDLDAHPAGTPFDFKAYANSFYGQILDKTKDKGLAISYVSLLPQNIRVNIGVDMGLSRKLGAAFQEIVLRETEFDSLDNVIAFVSPAADIVAEIKVIQKDIQQTSLEPKEETMEVGEPEQSFEPVVTSFLSDSTNDFDEKDAVKNSFYNAVKKNILDAVPADGSPVSLPGIGRVQLTAMSTTRIESRHLRSDVAEALRTGNEQVAVAHKEGVVLMVTDMSGNPIYFTDKLERGTADTGKPAYYNMRNPRLDKEGKIIFSDNIDSLRVAALAKRNKISKGDAKAILMRQLELYKKIRDYVNRNPSAHQLSLNINGGNYGTVITDKKLATPVSGLNLGGGSFAPFIAAEDDAAIGQRKGMMYVKVRGVDTMVQVEKGTFSRDLAGKLANLLMDDVSVKTATGMRLLTPGERIKLFEQFVYTGSDKIRLFAEADGSLTIRITGDKLNLSDKDEAKRQIVAYLTKLLPTREITKDQIKDRKVIKTTDSDYQKKFSVDAVLEQVVEGGKNRYYIVEYAKVNTKKDLLAANKYREFDVVDGVLTTKSRSYNEFIKENFVLFHPLDSAGHIQTLNPQFELSVADSELKKMSGKNVQKEVVEKAKTEVPKESGINGADVVDKKADIERRRHEELKKLKNGARGASFPKDTWDKMVAKMNAKYDAEIAQLSSGKTVSKVNSIINKIRNNPKFNKLIEQRGGIEATEKQLEEALQWYQNHPMSKYFLFEQAFDMINTEQPNSLATWSMNGITLYRGADYSDLYHEAWHGFSQAFLTPQERQSLYADVKKRSGSFVDYRGTLISFRKATDLQVEEYLAEDFREYVLSGGKKVLKESPKRNSIFRRMLNFLKALFGDTSIAQSATDDKVNATVKDLYEKLRIGDINEYSFAAENRSFNVLNKGMQRVIPSEPLESLSFEDSSLLVETMDSLFSELADDVNSGLDDEQKLRKAELEAITNPSPEEQNELRELQGRQTYRYTTVLFSDNEGLQTAYQYAQARIADIRNKMAAGEITPDVQKRLDLLDYALRNFGDVENLEKNKQGVGVIGYHLDKSEFVSEEAKRDAFMDELDELAETEGKEVFDRGGNEKSHFDMANKEVTYMIKGLHARDESGKILLNRLGVPQLAPFNETYRRLAETLKGISSPQKMRELLEKEAKRYKPFDQLLQKLGPVSYPGQSGREVDNWTKFWQTFNKPRIELTQMNLNQVTRDDKGEELDNPKYEVTIGNAVADYRKVGLVWESAFSQAGDHPYLLNDEQGNYLNLPALVQKYPDAASIKGKELDFLRDIGIGIKNNQIVRDELEREIASGNINISKFPEKLRGLEIDARKVRSINAIIGKINYLDPQTNTRKYVDGEWGNYQKLQKLESRYSDQYSDFMVRNAAGDAQSEFSQNTTLTQIVKRINESGSYQEMVGRPEMSYLMRSRNPFAKASIWLSSLFDLQENGGPKREGVILNVQNLSGVAMLMNGNALQDGIISAAADPYTKLIMDLHLQVMNGTPEQIRSADKKTSLSVFLNQVNTEGSEKRQYIDTYTFIQQGGVNIGSENALAIIVPYITAELERVRICRDLVERADEGYFDYYKRGSDFVMFDDVLSPEVKSELYSIVGGIDEHFDSEKGGELMGRIAEDVTAYFNKQFVKVKESFMEAPFFAQELMDTVRAAAEKYNIPKALTQNDQVIQDAILKSWIHNNWIHHFEEMILLYGDYALYNTQKEELHKRDASINSTGDILRTDQDFLNYVNSSVGRPYAQTKGTPEELLAYTGLMNTAVVADVEIPSVYEGLYGKELMDTTKYNGVNEGDAQGWVSFDSYRIMGKSLSDWSDEQEELFHKIVNGDYVSPESIKQVFPVRKMSYFGSLAGDGLPMTALHKFSLFPLVPSVIKGTNLEKLHDKMVGEGIDYALFKSGSKVATVSKRSGTDKLYSDVKRRILDETPFTKNTIFADFLKDQIKVSPKVKSKVTFFSQLRKLIDNGLMEGGVPTDYAGKDWGKLDEAKRREISPNYRRRQDFITAVRELGDIKKRELLDEMGWRLDEKGKPVGSIKNLLKVVVQELDRSDLAEHEIAFIDVGADGKLKHDLSFSQSAEKIEKVLMAVVNKRLVRYKVNGNQFVQVSGAGFENIGFAYTPQRDFDVASPEDLAKYGSNDLPTYHKGADGLTKAAKVKIAMQGSFKNLLEMQGVVRRAEEFGISRREALNQLLKSDEWINKNRELVTMVGARIPTQGANSMEFVEVYEFLPEEAGNIIVAPAEITAKSGTDYDYDKLPMMMPNLIMKAGEVQLAKPVSKAEARKAYDALIKSKVAAATLQGVDKDDLRRFMDPETFQQFEQAMVKLLGESYLTDLVEIVKEDNKIPEFDVFLDRINGQKVAENKIISTVRAIMEQSQYFLNLIKPNDTNLVEPIAKGLENKVQDYDPKEVTFGEKRKSGTRGFEILYNLYKHQSNAVGKETLGIGAIDNTYNTIFNAIGMHMSPSNGMRPEEYDALRGKDKRTKEENEQLAAYRRQVLLLAHNAVQDDNGDQVISLAKLKDAKGEHDISEIISQLMNGWVDVAKDAWIFNLQGNKELAPTLLFMVQAGVPIKQAVYLLSQPLVREYVRQQKIKQSTFAGPLGQAPENPFRFRVEARNSVLDNPAYGFNMDKITNYAVYAKTLSLTDKVGIKAFEEGNLLKQIDGFKGTDAERAAFLHFLEIEEMGKVITGIKTKTNVDTNTSLDLFEAQEAVRGVEVLKQDLRVPAKFIDSLINDSTIGAYFVQPFAFELFSDLFKLRNNPVLSEYVADMSGNKSVYEDRAKFVNEFKNDLISYIFQNAIRGFDTSVTSYKGSSVTEKSVEEVTGFKFGAFVKDGKLYVDMKQLKDDYEFEVFTTDIYKDRGLAPINRNAFNLFSEYQHFVYERETLRSMYSPEQAKNDLDYQHRFDVNMSVQKYKVEGEDEDTHAKHMQIKSYNEWLRDKALANIVNPWALFKSGNSIADKFVRIRAKYPNLLEEYALFANLQFNSNKQGYRNLRLSTSKLDRDQVERYHENLKNLANRSVIKTENQQENDYISDFFAKFGLYAVMQSGMNSTSRFSLNRVVPQDMFIRVMEAPAKQWQEKMNPAILDDYYRLFVENNIDKGARTRSKDYLTNSTLEKVVPIEDTRKLAPVVKSESEESPTVPIIQPAVEPQPISDDEVRDFLRNCFNT